MQNAQDLKESAEMHREIYRAIRSHNPPQAKLSMEQHLNLARMAQAAEAEHPADASPDTPADPAAHLEPSHRTVCHLREAEEPVFVCSMVGRVILAQVVGRTPRRSLASAASRRC